MEEKQPDNTLISPAGPGEVAPSSTSPAFSSPDGEAAGEKSGGRAAQNAALSLEDAIQTRVRGKLKNGAEPQGGRKKGGPRRPHPSPKIKKLRGEIALAQALGGKDLKAIAQDFEVSAPTLRAEINDALRSRIFTEARDFVQGTLVPKALKVVDEALSNGDTDTAKWLLDKTVVHQDATPWAGGGGGNGNGTESFESWRLELIRKVRPAGAPEALPAGAAPAGQNGPAASPGAVIDAEVVPKGLGPQAGE